MRLNIQQRYGCAVLWWYTKCNGDKKCIVYVYEYVCVCVWVRERERASIKWKETHTHTLIEKRVDDISRLIHKRNRKREKIDPKIIHCSEWKQQIRDHNISKQLIWGKINFPLITVFFSPFYAVVSAHSLCQLSDRKWFGEYILSIMITWYRLNYFFDFLCIAIYISY